MKKTTLWITIALLLVFTVVGAGMLGGTNRTAATTVETAVNTLLGTAEADDGSASGTSGVLSTTDGSVLDTSDMFTDRDLEQTADLTDATYITLTSDEDVLVDQEGVYVLSGDADNVTITVDAGDEAKVQLVLDNVSIVNENAAAIYVLSADKAFITLTGDSTLTVSGAYATKSLDSVVISKSDLTLNGTGSLTVVSTKGNGITSKDDLKITGGTYDVTASSDGLKANDSIRICDGTITIVSQKDALHSENDKDASLGYIYICNGTLNITAADDGIQGNAIVQIDGGVINIATCTEGIEGTYVQINGGTITIYAPDDGINVSQKSNYDLVMEINGGTITIQMASGDTDALDSNGDLYITGGTLNITAVSAFDYTGTGVMTGGNITVNGETVTELTESQMGFQMGGGMDGTGDMGGTGGGGMGGGGGGMGRRRRPRRNARQIKIRAGSRPAADKQALLRLIPVRPTKRSRTDDGNPSPWRGRRIGILWVQRHLRKQGWERVAKATRSPSLLRAEQSGNRRPRHGPARLSGGRSNGRRQVFASRINFTFHWENAIMVSVDFFVMRHYSIWKAIV
jgi:hypothetical protein